jgi:oligopeptide/dipeptide ABC transporter ATP-binding protein
MTELLLKVENLSVNYRRGRQRVQAVRGVSFELKKGEALGVVGESGCGKSTLALTLLRLLPENASEVSSGRIVFQGRDLLRLPQEELRRVRGGDIGMVFQDPFSALNPVLTVGEQMEEALEAHGEEPATRRVMSLLEKVQLPDSQRVYHSYPHQISGGQRQRVCIAMAIASGPKLLIADEPTTALDVTVQKEILNLLDHLRRDLNMAVLFITHNMGLLAERTDRLAVMYAGEIVELGATQDVLKSPLHPYAQGLLQSLPRLVKTQGRLPVLPGQPPDLRAVPSGCPFHPRCPRIFEPCPGQHPDLRASAGRDVGCHLY